MITIDKIQICEENQGLILIVESRGRAINLSADAQKFVLLRSLTIWCEEDLSDFAEKSDDYLWRCPELAIACLVLNRRFNKGKLRISDITIDFLNRLIQKLEKVKNESNSPN